MTENIQIKKRTKVQGQGNPAGARDFGAREGRERRFKALDLVGKPGFGFLLNYRLSGGGWVFKCPARALLLN